MSVTLLLILGGVTYLSRLAGTVLRPPPRGSIHRVLERFPAPLFAALAAAAIGLWDGARTRHEPLPAHLSPFTLDHPGQRVEVVGP